MSGRYFKGQRSTDTVKKLDFYSINKYPKEIVIKHDLMTGIDEDLDDENQDITINVTLREGGVESIYLKPGESFEEYMGEMHYVEILNPSGAPYRLFFRI